ncbi:hypothetical protein SDC9_167802 [bioreactor metagenome]|uniref:Uncharacterized protein n=1 Tax=bioreactor metagenome TaxID=1076179 RepID=A0A645G929_9ZZZZ
MRARPQGTHFRGLVHHGRVVHAFNEHLLKRAGKQGILFVPQRIHIGDVVCNDVHLAALHQHAGARKV